MQTATKSYPQPPKVLSPLLRAGGSQTLSKPLSAVEGSEVEGSAVEGSAVVGSAVEGIPPCRIDGCLRMNSTLHPLPAGTINVLYFHGFASQFWAIIRYPIYFNTIHHRSQRGGVPPPFLHSTILFSMSCFKNNTVKTPLLSHFITPKTSLLSPVGMQTQCSSYQRPLTRHVRCHRPAGATAPHFQCFVNTVGSGGALRSTFSRCSALAAITEPRVPIQPVSRCCDAESVFICVQLWLHQGPRGRPDFCPGKTMW